MPRRERRLLAGCGGELGTSTAARTAGADSCHPVLGNTVVCGEPCAVPAQSCVYRSVSASNSLGRGECTAQFCGLQRVVKG